MPLEREFKFRLSASELARLKRAGRVCELSRQINYYFDVFPELPFSRHRIGIRIRNQNGNYFLTIKFPAQGNRQKRGFHVQEEWESALSRESAQKVIRGKTTLTSLRARPIQILKKNGAKLPLKNIHRVGSMKNVRYRLEYPGPLFLELDHFTIGKKHFYEAECETSRPKSDLKAIRALWRTTKIPLRAEGRSKLARFLLVLRVKHELKK